MRRRARHRTQLHPRRQGAHGPAHQNHSNGATAATAGNQTTEKAADGTTGARGRVGGLRGHDHEVEDHDDDHEDTELRSGRNVPRELVIRPLRPITSRSHPGSHSSPRKSPGFIDPIAHPRSRTGTHSGVREKPGATRRKPCGFRPRQVFLRHTCRAGSLPPKCPWREGFAAARPAAGRRTIYCSRSCGDGGGPACGTVLAPTRTPSPEPLRTEAAKQI